MAFLLALFAGCLFSRALCQLHVFARFLSVVSFQPPVVSGKSFFALACVKAWTSSYLITSANAHAQLSRNFQTAGVG